MPSYLQGLFSLTLALHLNAGCFFVLPFFLKKKGERKKKARFNKHLQNPPLELYQKIGLLGSSVLPESTGNCFFFLFASLHCEAVVASSNRKRQVFRTHFFRG